MAVFNDLLGRLAGEYSSLLAENRELKARIDCESGQEHPQLEPDFYLQISRKAHRSFMNDPLHTAPVPKQFPGNPPPLVFPKKPTLAVVADAPVVHFQLERASGTSSRSPLKLEADSFTTPMEKWANIMHMLLVCSESQDFTILGVWANANTNKIPSTRMLGILQNLEGEKLKIQAKKHWLSGSREKFSQTFSMRSIASFLDPDQFIVRPNAKRLMLWCFFVALFSSHDAFMSPVELAFSVSYGFADRFVRFVTATFWTLDIIACFRSGYYDENAVAVLRARSVAIRYLKGWFAFDILLVVMDWLTVALERSEGATTLASTKVLRVARMFRVTRLLRMTRVESQLAMILRRSLATNAKGTMLFSWLIKAWLQYMVVIHFTTCAWYALGASLKDGWVRALEKDSAGVLEAYFTSAEWVVTHIHGTNRIFPQNAIEAIVECAASLLGFFFLLWCAARLTTTMHFMWDERLLHMQTVSARYLRSHKISDELTERVHMCIANVYETSALHEHQEQEAAWLNLLPKQIQMDLHEEARAKVIVLVPFFRSLSLRCDIGVRILCFEAMSLRIAIWPDKVFCMGHEATDVFFVESGRLAYLTDPGESADSMMCASLSSASSVSSEIPELGSLRIVRSILESKRCISEAALWTTWMHTGDLNSVVNSSLLALNVESFARIILHFHVVLSLVVNYARRYVFNLNKISAGMSDLVNLNLPFARSVTDLFGEMDHRDAHFIFISHYKIESGTEAAMMHEELCRQIGDNPFHQAFTMSRPVFLDSEDLENLKRIGSHIQNSLNMVVLLTPSVFERPWCLIEITMATRKQINIVPIRIERAGMKFEYPTEQFYEQLRTGQLFSQSDLELFRSLRMQLSEIEDAVRQILQNITLTFSPHRPVQIRALELNSVLQRCGINEGGLADGMSRRLTALQYNGSSVHSM